MTCIFLILPVILTLNLQAQESEYKDAPYFTGMPNYVIDYAEDIEFDNYHFFNGTNCPVVEGMKYLRLYVLKEGGKQASQLQLVDNYANALKDMGGTVFISGLLECVECDNDEMYLMAGKVVIDGHDVWIEVLPGKDGADYRLTEVIKGVMKQDVNTTSISEALKRDSRKASQGYQTIEANKTSAEITAVQTSENPSDFATKAELDALKTELDALKADVDAMKRAQQVLDVAPDVAVTDYDGNTYNTIRIGTQVWMGENLRTTRFKNGREISNVPTSKGSIWSSLITPAYCWYDNYPAYEPTPSSKNDTSVHKILPLGALYNWFAVSTGYLCPTGWHVPTDAEWATLITYLGGEIAGGKLKEIGLSYWQSPNTGATNESSFTALASGMRSDSYVSAGRGGYWWSASEFDASLAWIRSLSYQNTFVWRDKFSKQNGLSVRCLKDN